MQDKTKRVGVCFVAAVLFVALGCGGGGNPSTPTPLWAAASFLAFSSVILVKPLHMVGAKNALGL